MNENLLNFFDKKELETLMTQLENNKNIYSNAKNILVSEKFKWNLLIFLN